MIELRERNLLFSFISDNTCRFGLTSGVSFPVSIALDDKFSSKPQYLIKASQLKKQELFKNKHIKFSYARADFSFRFQYAAGKINSEMTGRFFQSVEGSPALTIDFSQYEQLMGLGAATGDYLRNKTTARLLNVDTMFYEKAGESYSTFPVLWKIGNGRYAVIFVHCRVPMRFESRATEAIFFFESMPADEDLDIFIFGGTPSEILNSYAGVTGKPFLAPLWSLGYQQSRWSYKSQKKVLEVAKKFRDQNVPCDAIYLDIHYMQNYKVFTFDHKNFPDPAGMTKSLDALGIKAVAIMDPGVKVEKGYSVYEEGVAQGHFCRNSKGEIYVGKVWPGDSVFPDFTRPETRTWWGDQHRLLVEKGIAGIWNDMNDPVLRIGKRYNPTEEDMLHQTTPHVLVRNLYANLEAAATVEGLKKYNPHKRPYVVTRSAFCGIQRYAAVWTGDNHSSWEHLKQNLNMVVNLSLSGVPICGADVGGFGSGPGIRGIIKIRKDRELVSRWLELGSLMPFFRMHTVLYSYDQEPWSFGDEVLANARKHIKRRYRLLPYLYRQFVNAAKTGEPIIRPVFYEFPDFTEVTEGMFLVGKDLLAAPVLHKGQKEIHLTLPPGNWYDYETGKLYEGENNYRFATPPGSYPLFVRAGTALPTAEPKKNTYETLAGSLIWEIYPDSKINGDYYLDNGDTPAESLSQYYGMTVSGKIQKNGDITLEFKEDTRRGKPGFQQMYIRLPENYAVMYLDRKQVPAATVSLLPEGRNYHIAEFSLPRHTKTVRFSKV